MLLQAKGLGVRQFGNRPVIETCGCRSRTASRISDFGHTSRRRWPAMRSELASISRLADAIKNHAARPLGVPNGASRMLPSLEDVENEESSTCSAIRRSRACSASYCADEFDLSGSTGRQPTRTGHSNRACRFVKHRPSLVHFFADCGRYRKTAFAA